MKNMCVCVCVRVCVCVVRVCVCVCGTERGGSSSQTAPCPLSFLPLLFNSPLPSHLPAPPRKRPDVCQHAPQVLQQSNLLLVLLHAPLCGAVGGVLGADAADLGVHNLREGGRRVEEKWVACSGQMEEEGKDMRAD